MKITIIISTANNQALKIIRDLIAKNHLIDKIFLIFDAVYLTNDLAWSAFAKKNNISIIICTASAERRAIKRESLPSEFKLGSIGALVESCEMADKVICL